MLQARDLRWLRRNALLPKRGRAMKFHTVKSLIGSLALAGLHLSCAGSDDSDWQRPQMTPAPSSWDTRAAYDAPPPVYRASAEQSSYHAARAEPYTPAAAPAGAPAAADAFPPPAPSQPQPAA